MAADSHELGRWAEDAATRHLMGLGWRVLGRNVTNRYGELDIVALDAEKELVVVEVRFRTVGEVLSPSDSIGPKKLRSLVRASRKLVDTMGWTGFWRIDLIGITARGSVCQMEHIHDITEGMEIPT